MAKAMTKTLKKVSKTQAETEAKKFREAVQHYIETGSSTVLSIEERVKVFPLRKAYRYNQLPWYKKQWENISSLWKK